jgi:hypothetical protein
MGENKKTREGSQNSHLNEVSLSAMLYLARAVRHARVSWDAGQPGFYAIGAKPTLGESYLA